MFAQCGSHFLFHGLAPGQILLDTQEIILAVQRAVAQLRLIGEEAGNGLAEIGGIMLPVGLINLIDQQSAAVFFRHIDVIAVRTGVPGADHHAERPIALRLFPMEDLSLQPVGQIHNLLAISRRNTQNAVILKFPGRGHHAHKSRDHTAALGLFLLEKAPSSQMQLFAPPLAGEGLFFHENILAAQAVRFSLQSIIGKAGGEMAVVQNPHLHIPLSGFVQNDIHIRPPLIPAKLGVGPAFHAHRAAACAVDRAHQLPQSGFILAMLPEKGQNMIVRIAGPYAFQSLIHFLPP